MKCPKCGKPMRNIPNHLGGKPSKLWACKTKDCPVSRKQEKDSENNGLVGLKQDKTEL